MALHDVFGDAVGTIREHYAAEADREDVQKVILLMEAMDAVLMGEFAVSGGTPVDKVWEGHFLALRSAVEALDVAVVAASLAALRRRTEELGDDRKK